ncbi:MAG: peptidase domain-containing ABC transporter [Flavobacteriales bacterium]
MESESKLSPIQRFWMLLRPDKAEIRNVYVYAVFNGLVTLSLPLGIQSIINHIQGGQVNMAWVVLVGVVLLGVMFAGILQVNQMRITENIQQKIFARAAFEFAYRIPRLRLESLFGQYAPELMNRFFDVVAVQKGLSKILIDFSTALIQVVFSLILLSLYHPFFIMFSFILVLLVYVIFRFTAKPGLDSSLKESKMKYAVAHWLEELARTKLTFKLAGETDLPLEKVNGAVDNYLEYRENHFKILIKQFSLMIGFKILVASGLLIIGSILVMEQQMNIGQFVASEVIILLILNSVEKLIQSLESIYDILTSLEKIGFVTDLDLENNDGHISEEVLTRSASAIELHNVSFNYPTRPNDILKNFSLKINQRERLLIYGKNDSGKSTLFKLMTGLYTPKTGSVLINDVPFDDFDITQIRTHLGEYYSDDVLFEGSILENITLGRKAATLEQVQYVIKNLRLETFIKDQPQGYRTIISPGGFQFPRSVTTRLLLARCIVAQPKLVLLRDSFSNLNEDDRHHIMEFLTDPKNDWTIVFFSSNLNLAKYVENVAVLGEGSILKKAKVADINLNDIL